MRLIALPVAIVSILLFVPLVGCQSSGASPEEPAVGPDTSADVDRDDEGEQEDEPTPPERPEGASDYSTQEQDLWITEVAGPFHHPWAVAFLPDGRKLVTERRGRLLLVEDGDAVEVDGLPTINSANQGGLLDVSLHPDFGETPWVYLTFSKPESGGQGTATAVARGQLEGTTLTEVEELFVQNQYSGSGRHYGSRIVWLGDGTFLFSIGDRGSEPMRAQDTQDHAGSVLRLNADGTVPSDNPFVDDGDVLDEIYTFGNRNIQGMARDAETGVVWAADHGPSGGDILYTIEAGNNYGWPIFTYGMDYSTGEPMSETQTQDPDELDEVVAPAHRFDPSHPPSGLVVVRGGFFDQWQGDILSGGLRTQEIRRLVQGNGGISQEEPILSDEFGRIRDVRQGPDGAIYVLPDSSEAKLFRIDPA